MKNLKDYILEAEDKDENETNDVADSKSISLNFTDLEEKDDVIKSLGDISKDGITVTVEDDKVSITVTKEGVENVDSLQDILQQYADKLMKSQKRTTDETYAQKVKSFCNSVTSLTDYIDEVEG